MVGRDSPHHDRSTSSRVRRGAAAEDVTVVPTNRLGRHTRKPNSSSARVRSSSNLWKEGSRRRLSSDLGSQQVRNSEADGCLRGGPDDPDQPPGARTWGLNTPSTSRRVGIQFRVGKGVPKVERRASPCRRSPTIPSRGRAPRPRHGGRTHELALQRLHCRNAPFQPGGLRSRRRRRAGIGCESHPKLLSLPQPLISLRPRPRNSGAACNSGVPISTSPLERTRHKSTASPG